MCHCLLFYVVARSTYICCRIEKLVCCVNPFRCFSNTSILHMTPRQKKKEQQRIITMNWNVLLNRWNFPLTCIDGKILSTYIEHTINHSVENFTPNLVFVAFCGGKKFFQSFAILQDLLFFVVIVKMDRSHFFFM